MSPVALVLSRVALVLYLCCLMLHSCCVTETLSFNDLALKSSKEIGTLGIKLDRNMAFNTHIKNICRKAGQRLSALLGISSYLD